MKELLYLKDEQIKDFIQLLFYAYRETISDPREILAKNSFGPAHLRALNLIERNPGTNLSELMFQLKITKQSLNRVLRDLLKSKMIKRIFNALKNSEPGAVIKFKEVLEKIINGKK
jgi:DNA-binding MarR family transcriptional regulator